MTDTEVGQLLKTLAKEAKKRTVRKTKELTDKNAEQVEFLGKCRALTQFVVPRPIEVDIYRLLERAYQLFKRMVSTIQAHLQETKEEQKEETARLLLAQHTAFSEAYKVLQDHMEESVLTKEVLRDWPTHYGQVYQQTRQTRQGIQDLEGRKMIEAALRQTKEEQIVLETNKLQKLEWKAHQWVQQALPNLEKVDIICPHMK